MQNLFYDFNQFNYLKKCRNDDFVCSLVSQIMLCMSPLDPSVFLTPKFVSSPCELNFRLILQLWHLNELSSTRCICIKLSSLCTMTKQNCQIHQVKQNLCVAQAKCWILQAHQCFGWVCKPPMLALRCKHIGHQYRNFCCFYWYYRVFSQVTLV